MDPKWCPPEAGENGKRSIDGVPPTRNTVTNRWDKDVTPPSGLVTPAAAPPPQSPAWQPTAAPPTQAPSSSDTKIGGALLAGVHGNIGQQYSGSMGQPSASQLAAFNANAAASSASAKEARQDEICRQMEALKLEHSTLA